MFAHFLKLGATREAILAAINVLGEEDIGLDKLATLKGIATAIKDGDTTVEQAFPPQPEGWRDGCRQQPRGQEGRRRSS